MGSVEEVSRLLSEWEDADSAGRDVTPTLTQLAEIFEVETQNFLKQNPDPFDDRHPSRLQPECTLGHILKAVFRNQRVVDEMVKVYCQRDVVELNTVVCRFLLALLPGLESVVFQEEGFVLRLFQWAETAPLPLQSYATGLLAAAMDVPEIAASYREKNANLVPLMLRRLYELSKGFLQNVNSDASAYFSLNSIGIYDKEEVGDKFSVASSEGFSKSHKKATKKKKEVNKSRYSPMFSGSKTREKKSTLKIPPVDASLLNDGSNSNWTDYMFGSYQVFPLTTATQQKHILQYLTPMGEYQELIGHVFEKNALTLILRYIDFQQNQDVRLAFEALKYLASLLCHKKIAIEFLNVEGLQLLLKVPRPSIAATGVSICLYYLGYLEEAMEKICMLPYFIISDLVTYALWLLESSHNSSRCHATLFFGFGFTFKVILQHFDQQDGLRKLFNVMSTLDIFVTHNERTLSDDEIFANRLTTKHVCGSLKRYFEAHLATLVEEKRILSCRPADDLGLDNSVSRSASLTSEVVENNMEILHDLSLTPLSHWKPVNEFVNLDGITFLLELISSYLEIGYSGRVETVKNAMDVLKICALTVPAQLKFCEKLTSPDYVHVTGISILLQAAEGELMPMAEVQHSALLTIVNCVCTKFPAADQNSRSNSTPKRKVIRQTEDLLNKVWKAVRIKNGIIILINLLSIKTPLTDADSIRALACKALCGLARSETVKQIISKLPLVTNGQLIDLMKEPVLQEKCHDHVQFCKHGLELIERVTGAPITAGSQSSMNMNKICVSEVVAKTKVVYNEAQLLQLICDHLTQKGFLKTVLTLQQEMEEKSVTTKLPISLGAFPSRNKDLWQTPSKSVTPGDKSRIQVCGSISTIPPPSVPLRIILNKKVQIPDIKSPLYRLQKPQACSGNYVQSPALQKMKRQSTAQLFKDSLPSISLDSIVTEYLRKQHALCKNPMLACPPFDLFTPHKCPEPHFKRNAPINCVLRIHKREMYFQNGGYRGATLNTKHIYSRFRLHRTCRDEEGRCDFTVCSFFTDTEPFPKMLVGTASGKMKVFNINSAKELLFKDCHSRGISHIATKEPLPLLITSDGGRVGNSSLWNFLGTDIDLLHNFSEVSYMEFSKQSSDKLIGTKHDAAVIYDINTFAELQTFPVGDLGNNYLRNTARFDYSDELVLSDGLLYDVRSGKMLHKLDKFNANMNGVFHPNGREIISNSEIWDIRTFKLLRTVSGLNQCRVTFNNPGTVIYAISFNKESKLMEKSCFYTFDAYDYNTISTVDVKRPVYALACDQNDRFIATVESLNGLECICRMYEVGRTKQLGDENGDESEDSDETDEDEVDDEDDDDNDDDNEGQNDAPFEAEEDNDELSWIATSGSSDDDDETLFALNTSMDF